MADHLRLRYLDRTVANLKRRDIVSFTPAPEAIDGELGRRPISENAAWSRLHVFGTRGGKVSTVIRLVSTGGDKKLFTAFTTNDITLSDNFDRQLGRTVPVENVTFGAAKVLIERHEMEAFIHDPKADRVANVVAAYVKAKDPNPEHVGFANHLKEEMARGPYPGEPAFVFADRRADERKDFLASVLAGKVMGVDADIAKLAIDKKIDPSDPVLSASMDRKADIEDRLQSAVTNGSASAVLNVYRKTREDLLPLLPRASPYFAKMAFGRGVYFPLIETLWSSPHFDLGCWTVFLTRRYFMAANLDLAYLFCLLHAHGPCCETSAHDAFWAYQWKPLQKETMGPLCAFKHRSNWPTRAVEAVDPALVGPHLDEFWAGYHAVCTKAKLGVVNDRVARSLLGEPFRGAEELSYRWACQYLRQCGWFDFMEKHVAPLCHTERPPTWDGALPGEFVRLIRSSTLESVEQDLAYLSRSLR